MPKVENTQHDYPENGEPTTVTVAELREYLEGFSEDTPVYLSTQSGDYWRTQVRSTIVLGNVENSNEVALIEGRSWGAYEGDDAWLTVRLAEEDDDSPLDDEDEYQASADQEV